MRRDFVFVVGGGRDGRGDGLVVVENDVLEGIGDVVLQVRGSLGAEGVDELAGVGVRAGLRVVGVGVAVLHQEVMQGEVDFVFADVVGERVHDLAALLIPDVRLVLDQDDGTLAADFAGAAAQVAVELVLQKAVHVVAAVLLLHDHERGVLGERLRHHVGAFDAAADELVRPPLMAQFMRGDEVSEVDIGGLLDAADEADAFGKRNGVGKGLREGAVARDTRGCGTGGTGRD